ncbi:DUF4225 domain-containing protein [Pantoea rwandensis]|uniref:DUF4225 domain-containing protein n=1 Tax=Pantoea rwandensis TaxID=1076550 RepID=A0A1X1CTP4_9GAMM|nr:DUF4225 domain-containing protein [Pantoea rwandensis]ORM67768.1 hypothetical protein HA51_17320 [Pantoea rwandensis]
MDNYWDNKKLSGYFLTMANLEAQQLYNKANEVSLIHLRNGFTQMNFMDDVKKFIDHQLKTIRSANSEVICQECLTNLQKEHKNISIQDQMLRSGQAALHALVQFINSDGVWHWIINGVGVVLGSLQVIAGIGVIEVSLATGMVFGVGFGALLVAHGANSIQESILNLYEGVDDSKGFMKKTYIAGAEFFGFDQRAGELAYSVMDLGLSAYGMGRLIIKPEIWRLFRYLPTDYVRGVKEMSRFDLGVEIYNDSMAIKSFFNTTDD